MRLDQIERLAHAGQHAEREHVDLEDAQLLDVVLVPFDEGAVVHRAIADRHRLGQQPLGQDEAADMLRQMARHADHLLGQFDHPAQVRVVEVEPGLGHAVVVDLLAPAAPDASGDRGGDVLGQSHDLADLADRAARAVMDHRRGDARRVRGHICHRCAGSLPRAAHARNRRRCRAAPCAPREMKRSNSRSLSAGFTAVMPRQ